MSSGGRLVQIVPHAPGEAGGVGDFARQLAGRLQELHGITSVFLSAAPINSSRTADGFEVLSPLRDVFGKIDSSLAFLLHYVNYGYHPQGVPIWLPALLRRMQKSRGKRLLTVFHELYAAGSWRQSAFWLRPVQKHLVRVIARLSAVSMVTNETHRAQLRQLARGAHIIVQPVPSNFGEPSISSAELAGRDPHRWVICGGSELIERSLATFRRNATFIPTAYSPRELLVVGGADRKTIRASLAAIRDMRTHYYPHVEARVATQILSSCTFAWIDYFHDAKVPLATILKSTVFAAYCAHGVIPVFPHNGSPVYLGRDILSGPFFVNQSEQKLPSEPERVAVAQELHHFYEQNASTRRLAQTVATALGPQS
ncbi:hypothetical protein BH20VER3_BH20VER3_10130 [soil metagenome]